MFTFKFKRNVFVYIFIFVSFVYFVTFAVQNGKINLGNLKGFALTATIHIIGGQRGWKAHFHTVRYLADFHHEIGIARYPNQKT